MRFVSGSVVVLAALAPLCLLAQDGAPTLEERVTAVERAAASLETRLELRTTRNAATGSDPDAGLGARIAQLERELGTMDSMLRDLERQQSAMLREMSQLRREASEAQRLARDAANRIR